MPHLTRERIELVSRTKKVIGQLESVLRGLEEDAHCADILNHMPRKNKASAEAAQDIIEIVRTYLK